MTPQGTLIVPVTVSAGAAAICAEARAPSIIGWPSDLFDALIAYLPLDETSGTRADAHNGHDLTDVNSVGFTTGAKGNAASFDPAASQYFSRAHHADFSRGNTDWAWVFWIFPTTNPPSPFRYLMGKAAACGTTVTEYYAYRRNTEAITFGVSDGAAEKVVTSTDLAALNAWSMVILEHEAAVNTIRIYINDGAAGELVYSGFTPYTNTAALTIGTLFTGCPDSIKWKGHMDEVCLLSKATSASERAFLYGDGTPPGRP